MDTPSILIVDDDDMVANLLSFILQSEGFEVRTAEHGIAALRMLEDWTPSLVITDIMMPVMDGFSFVRQLRIRPRLALVPVIFLTAANRARNRLQSFKLGADDFLEKPVHREEIVFRVRRVLASAERMKALVRTEAEITPSRGCFAGDMQLLGLGSLLNILEMERKTGVLTLTDGTVSGTIRMREGRVVGASLAGDRDAEAIYVLATWTAGTFSFVEQEIGGDDSVKRTTAQLLLEAARRFDDEAQLELGND